MVKKLQNLYIYQWPGFIGELENRVVDLIELLKDEYKLIIVPNKQDYKKDTYWIKYLKELKIQIQEFEKLPDYTDGYFLIYNNFDLFKNNTHRQILSRNLKILLSVSNIFLIKQIPEDIFKYKEIHKVLIDSLGHFNILPKFIEQNKYEKDLINFVFSDVWVNPENFPFFERPKDRNVIGRVSKAKLNNYSYTFPNLFKYIIKNDNNSSIKILGWSDELKEEYKWFNFDSKWELLNENQIPVPYYLSSIDHFIRYGRHIKTDVYPRAIVEAMLTGLVPIISSIDGANLYIPSDLCIMCSNDKDIIEGYNFLKNNPDTFKSMSYKCSEYLRRYMSREKHIKIWKDIIS